MKTSAEVVGLKPQPRHPEPGRIRYETVPSWTMPPVLPREQTRSRVIGRDWRDRLLIAKP
jgi:hypothetical protein